MTETDRPTGENTGQYGAEKTRFARQITKARIQTHTQNISYFLLFHCNNGYASAPQCYITRASSVSFLSKVEMFKCSYIDSCTRTKQSAHAQIRLSYSDMQTTTIAPRFLKKGLFKRKFHLHSPDIKHQFYSVYSMERRGTSSIGPLCFSFVERNAVNLTDVLKHYYSSG